MRKSVRHISLLPETLDYLDAIAEQMGWNRGHVVDHLARVHRKAQEAAQCVELPTTADAEPKGEKAVL